MISIPRQISTNDYVLHVDPITRVPRLVDADSIVNGCRVMIRPGVVPEGMAAMVSRINGRNPQVVMLDFRDVERPTS